jgi:hypothetical protein
MTGDATHTRNIGHNVQGLQMLGIDAAYTAAHQLSIVGDTTHPNLAYPTIQNFNLVGVKLLHPDIGSPAVMNLSQIVGIDFDPYLLGLDVDTMSGEINN